MSEAVKVQKQIAMGKNPQTKAGTPKIPMKKGGSVKRGTKSNC